MFDLVIETILKAGNFIYFIFFISIYAWFLIIKKYFFIKSEMRDSDVLFEEAINFIKRDSSEKLISLLEGKDRVVTESLLYIIKHDCPSALTHQILLA